MTPPQIYAGDFLLNSLPTRTAVIDDEESAIELKKVPTLYVYSSNSLMNEWTYHFMNEGRKSFVAHMVTQPSPRLGSAVCPFAIPTTIAIANSNRPYGRCGAITPKVNSPKKQYKGKLCLQKDVQYNIIQTAERASPCHITVAKRQKQIKM